VAALVWACSTCQPGEPARIDRRLQPARPCLASGTPADVARRIIFELGEQDIGVLDGEAFSNWIKRQPRREDDSVERVRRHRNGT
jgi:hypothetical protein